jgi:hypothetical protein
MRQVFYLALLSLVIGDVNLGAQSTEPGTAGILRVVLDPSRTGPEIPEDFVGLSYEKTILAQPGVFTPGNAVLQRLLVQLGKGNLRMGAGAVESTGWTRQPRSSSTGDRVVTADDLDSFYAFVKATGWNVVHAVNLRSSNPGIAADEAQYAAMKAGSSLVAFEIGNEPDLKPGDTRYAVEDYIREFRAFASAIRERVPGARFVGPGATCFPSRDLQFLTRGVDEWAVPFAGELGKEIVQLTQHIHVVGQPYQTEPEESFVASIPTLLSSVSRNRYTGVLEKLVKAAEKAGIPYRINETNSCYHGGKEGVSNTFASALWGADYLFTLASYGASGVNLHAGTQFYTPIETRETNQSLARPLYYGLLLFRMCAHGRLIPANVVSGPKLEVSTYATLARDGSVAVAIINREQAKDVTVQLDASRYFKEGRLLRLEAPSLSATSGVTLGGAPVSPDGSWKPASNQTLSREDRFFLIHVPASSAAVVNLQKAHH